MSMHSFLAGLFGGIVPTIIGMITIAFTYGRVTERLSNHIDDKDIHTGFKETSKNFMPRSEQERYFRQLENKIDELLRQSKQQKQ